ncbi:MAG: transcription antitermination factor NusB [bacterium]|jgi:N utilization substance protein B
METDSVRGDVGKPASRRAARKKLLEICFEADFHLVDDPAAFVEERLLRPPENDPSDPDGHIVRKFEGDNLHFIKSLAELVLRNTKALDAVLERYPWEWSFDRIGRPERIVLRIALAELLFTDTSYKIVINEALDLAKAYGESDANRFVNGILGSIYSDLESIRNEFSD